MTSLFERLNDNEIILLDGGVSTEIQKRGVAMDPDVWSGLGSQDTSCKLYFKYMKIISRQEHK